MDKQLFDKRLVFPDELIQGTFENTCVKCPGVAPGYAKISSSVTVGNRETILLSLARKSKHYSEFEPIRMREKHYPLVWYILMLLFRASESKMVSRFPTVTEEILAVYTAAVLSNTKKTTKFGLAVFTSTVLLFVSVKLSAKTDPKRFLYTFEFKLTITSTKPLFSGIEELKQ